MKREKNDICSVYIGLIQVLVVTCNTRAIPNGICGLEMKHALIERYQYAPCGPVLKIAANG